MWQRDRMSWEKALLDLFDDLEAQAAGLAQAERDEDVADLARAEYAEIGIEARLHGSVGEVITLETTAGTRVRARLQRVGRGCAAVTPVEVRRVLHLVNLAHVVSVSTPSARAATEPLLDVTSRLGLASAVRHLVEEVDGVVLVTADGRRRAGDVVRVGKDFVEVVPEGELPAGGTLLVPLSAVVTLSPA
jgi:hypothetical protein